MKDLDRAEITSALATHGIQDLAKKRAAKFKLRTAIDQDLLDTIESKALSYAQKNRCEDAFERLKATSILTEASHPLDYQHRPL